MYTQKTYSQKASEVDRKWFVVDATDKVVGRLATEIATVLRGKHKATFSPNIDGGDFVIVTNSEKVRFTGNKLEKKVYHWHTNHIGGLKSRTAKEQLEKFPDRIIYDAVKRMLPKTSLGRKQLTKLKVFVGPTHSHDAQNPTELELKGKRV
jgi:large subunit ribosomal protein L13